MLSRARSWVSATIVAALILAGCTPVEESTVPSTPPSSSLVAASTTTPPQPSEHRIGVRQDEDGPEFYDRSTGDLWVARGFNHWRWQDPGGFLLNAAFRVTDGELAEAKQDLETMAGLGYNAVRIWLSACYGVTGCFGDGDEATRRAYLENVAEYLRKAKELGIYVVFTVDDVVGTRYNTSKAAYAQDFAGFNQQDLTEGGIADQTRFWTDVVGGLIDVGAPLDAIWAYELRNEQFLESHLPPYGLDRPVTTANGETYDLSDESQAKRMQLDGIAYWAQSLSDTIKSLDPTALVTVGFFPSGQGPITFGDPDRRLVDPRVFLDVEGIDFLDFHSYPGLGPGGWDTPWTNALLGDDVDKPIVLGEIGAFFSAYDTVEEAITSQTDWLAKACNLGFDGYLYWTWTNLGIYEDTWDAVAENGAIADALSPFNLPDPCVAPPPATGNLAYGAATTASLFEDTDEFYAPPSNAVDGSEGTWWTAPGNGPQWIEIDLGEETTVGLVRLNTRLGADLPMRVVISLLDENRAEVASQELNSGASATPVDLEHNFEPPAEGVRFVRVTTFRDGWIVWHEIEVYGPQ